MVPIPTEKHYLQLAQKIRQWGKALGFDDVGITDVDLTTHEQHLLNWLQQGFHGEMDYMQEHGTKRSRPQELLPGTIRVISVRMNYWPEDSRQPATALDDPVDAYISRYALGRDYHKVMRKRLQKLADQIQEETGEFGYRAFVDSAPVLEKALAEKAGIGWIGKHSNLINKKVGSWFFLGELYTDLPLPCDNIAEEHCGTCTSCIEICPTNAIVAPYQVDARKCISYLTIELKGSIPVEFRKAIGNRIYGCDDCQIVCPWNRFSTQTNEPDYLSRHQLDQSTLLELFNWTEAEFLNKTVGSAIRRIGYERWQRNIAVALGNGTATQDAIQALNKRRQTSSTLVQQHIDWALQQLT